MVGARDALFGEAVAASVCAQERVYNWGDQCESMFFVETGWPSQCISGSRFQRARATKRSFIDFPRCGDHGRFCREIGV
eukprot:1695516-Amphidinium_carterae.3